MKLLFENWRAFLAEKSTGKRWFGKSFQTFKRRIAKGDHPLVAAERTLRGGTDEKTGQPLKGSTRKVFQLPDNDDLVVKVINVDLIRGKEWMTADDRDEFGFRRAHKILSNKNEASIQFQMANQDLFPRIWDAAEDYSWILVERVELFKDHNHFMESLGLANANISRKEWLEIVKEMFRQLQGKETKGARAQDKIDHEYADWAQGLNLSTTVADAKPAWKDPNWKDPEFAEGLEKTPNKAEGGPRPDEMTVIKYLLGVPHYRKLFQLLSTTQIQEREIRWKNLGIGTLTGKLVMLDASLWEDNV